MRPLTRTVLLLSLATAAAAGLRADEVQVLPALAVNAAAGPRSAQPTQLAPADTAIARDLAELGRTVAGFSLNDAGAHGFGTTTSLRGLANTPYFSDASVPVYLDGIPLGSAFTFPSALFDFASVTVHRGPQAATQFGRAGDAGVIQLASTRPGAAPSGTVRVATGNHGLLTGRALVESAGTGPADFTAGVGAIQRDGYIRNTTLNRTVDDRDSLAGHVRVNYRPAEGTEISLHVLASRDRDGAQALVPLGSFHAVARGKEGVTDIDFDAVALGLSRRLAGGTLTATTSWSNWDLSPYSNRLVVFGGADFDSALAQSQHTFAEEIRFTGGAWSGGAFWSTGRTHGDTDRTFSGFPVERSAFTTDADSAAVFGRASFPLADGWTLLPGLRAERTAKDFLRLETIPAATEIRRDGAWSALLPSLAASKRLDETTDLTFTVAAGFKPGGYSAFTGRSDLAGFGAQRNWSLEAAYSTVQRDANLAYTARAYASRVRGYQVERSFAVPNSFTDEYLVVNAREARVLGFELESTWRPARDVTVALAASVCRATLQDFRDPFTGDNFSGRQAPYAPAGNARLRVDFRPARGLFAGAGLTWTGTTYYDEQETAMFAQRSYVLVEADAGYAFAQGELRLFGRNLGDKEYYSAITPGVGHATPGAPLTWGGEVVLRW